jgi:hypothetical protein
VPQITWAAKKGSLVVTWFVVSEDIIKGMLEVMSSGHYAAKVVDKDLYLDKIFTVSNYTDVFQ